MPLRVKCRCGQEVVLRFNEWVHALFGLLVISLIVNGTSLAYIAIRLESSRGPAEATPQAGGPGAQVGTAGASPQAPPAAASSPTTLVSSVEPAEGKGSPPAAPSTPSAATAIDPPDARKLPAAPSPEK